MPKLLAVDLDGTLFYPKGRRKKYTSNKNMKFLRDFIDAGNRVALVTSRSYQFVEKLQAAIDRPLDLVVCNGAYITVDGEAIRDEGMNKQALKDVLDHLDNHHRPIAYLMSTEDHPCIIKKNVKRGRFLMWCYGIYYKAQGVYQEPYIVDNDLFEEQFNNDKHIYKVMTFYGFGRSKKQLSKEINKLLRKDHPDIESSWSLIVNELTPLDCNKSCGLQFLCKKLNINDSDVYVIGDSGNDISMFNRYHEHSFVMAHAYPSVKKYAKYSVSRVFKLRKYVLEGENK